jgi:hypothetical protein
MKTITKKSSTAKKNIKVAAAVPIDVASTTAASSAIAGSASSTASTTDLPSLVAQMSTFLDTAEAQLGPEPVLTTATQKRRVSKPRKGFEKVLGMIAPVVTQHQLESPSLNVTGMLQRSDTAQQLMPLQTRLSKISSRVGNEAFNAQTDAWSMGLQFYSLLKRRAKGDGELAKTIEPLAKVFSYRHPAVKATKALKVQTRAKAKLKEAMALAQRHGVEVPAATSSETPAPVATPAPAAPVQAAAPAAPVTPSVPVAPPSAPAVTVAPASPVTNGAASTGGAH